MSISTPTPTPTHDLQDLSGKVAVVTGAGSGLGAATARAFATAGCRVACLDLKGDAAERTAHGLGERGEGGMGVACDIGDAEAVVRAIDAVVARWGRLDFAVNCAGTDTILPVSEMSVEQWDRVIGVNLRGPFLVAKASLPAMKRQGGGHIVNVASTAAVRAWANASAYHASKFGLVGFGRGLGVEGRADNIKVTTVIPGGMRTGWFDTFPEQGIPMPDEATLQDPATVAAAIVFAVRLPASSVLQELIITPPLETSWP